MKLGCGYDFHTGGRVNLRHSGSGGTYQHILRDGCRGELHGDCVVRLDIHLLWREPGDFNLNDRTRPILQARLKMAGFIRDRVCRVTLGGNRHRSSGNVQILRIRYHSRILELWPHLREAVRREENDRRDSRDNRCAQLDSHRFLLKLRPKLVNGL